MTTSSILIINLNKYMTYLLNILYIYINKLVLFNKFITQL